MFLNSILFLFLILFSIGLFFINNLYIVLGLFILCLIIVIIFKIPLPIYLPLIIFLLINFLFNYLLGSLYEAFLVTIRLIIMFMLVNIVIYKIGILNIGKIIGRLFHSKSIELIIMISLTFIPIMIKEIHYILNSLKTKNFTLNCKNILMKPHIFVITFFSNLLRRIDDLEKVLISKGIDE